MPNVTIEVRTTCPTCAGDPHYHEDDCPAHLAWDTPGSCDCDHCPTCHGTGTVVDAERSQWLRTVAEWAAHGSHVEVSQTRPGGFLCHVCWGMDAHAPDCPHVLAKKTMSVV